jgi:hypothetical protein
MMAARLGWKQIRPWVLGGLLLMSVMAFKPVQDSIVQHIETDAPDPDVLYFASPSSVRRLTVGYESLVADLYWMRAIQYYGRRDEAALRLVRYKNLDTLLDIVTTLDPDLLDAYSAGSVFLSEADPIGAGRPEEALRLLDKGIARHPQNWRLSYDKGFVWFWYLKNYEQAGRVWLTGSRLPDAPHWLESLAAMALSQGGAIESAKAIWERQFRESTRADVKDNARNHLLSFQVAEDLWTMEFFLERLQAERKAPPEKLDELVTAGMLRFVPLDPLGTPYEYDAATGIVALSPASKVRYLKVDPAYRTAYLARLNNAVKHPERTSNEKE